MSNRTLIQVCGVTDPDDAVLAARMGVDRIGIVLHQSAKRGVTPAQAAAIAEASRSRGAEPVAIFVDTPTDDVIAICSQIQVTMVQLHGPRMGERAAELSNYLDCIYLCEVDEKGVLTSSHCKDLDGVEGTPILYDSAKGGGSGNRLPWNSMRTFPNHPIYLGGGLTAGTVAEAIRCLHPDAVHVSSGVEIPGTVRKDPERIAAFVEAVIQVNKELKDGARAPR